MINKAPYYSQWSDPSWVEFIISENVDPCIDPTWVGHGFDSEEQYRYWAKRLCGIACLESVLDYWHIARANRFTMLQEAIKYEVYVPKNDGAVLGLVYKPFVKWVYECFALSARSIANVAMPQFLASIPSGGFGIASVSQEIRYPMRERMLSANGGHLVLIVGQEDGKVIFHNPSGVPPYQAFAALSIHQFSEFFAGRGIIIEKP